MKKLFILIFSLCFTLMMQAQVIKTANVFIAGSLSTVASSYLFTVTNLTVTGTIDARDFVTMRMMRALSELDLSGATILAYSGLEGSGGIGMNDYLADGIPQNAFYVSTQTNKHTISIILPSSLTSIGNNAFRGSMFFSIDIPASLSSIGDGAFMGCEFLRSINIPSSVTSIGTNAFKNCLGLTSMTIPSSITSIANGVFENSNITSIIIPSLVTSIGNGAFAGTKLTSINIPTSVTSIGNRAFAGTSLTSINIPSTVNTIGNGAFEACGLTSITLPNSVTSIGDSTFMLCSQLTSCTIPSSVLSIGNQTFEFSGLISINIPSSVKSIGNMSFLGCSGLTSINIPSSITSIGSRVFEACTGLTSMTVDINNLNYLSIDGVLFNKTKTKLYGCPIPIKGNYTIPSTIVSIEDYAFFGNGNLSSINIPSSVTSIGIRSFQGCDLLTSIIIPSSVTSIGDNAFYALKGLTSIFVSSTVPTNLSSSIDVFVYVDKVVCILYVPVGSKSAYQNAIQWKDFKNILEFTPTGLYEEKVERISLYPNPITDGIFINGLKGMGILTLSDLSGKILFTKQITGNENISANTLPKGVYILRITTADGIIVRKVIKK